jgi:hypothetical protein
MNAKLRVEIVFDPESRNWSYYVPSLGIVGGAESHEGAERDALEAISFTLEADNQAPAPEGGAVEYVPLQLGSLDAA